MGADRLAVRRQSYSDRMRKLKRGICLAWFLNWVMLVLFIEASLIWGFMGKRWSDQKIGGFLMMTVPVSMILSVLIMLVVSACSSRMILTMTRGAGLTEVESGPLKNVVEEMSTAAGLPSMPRVFVEDTSAVNAYAMGSAGDSMVVLTAPLVKMMDREELQGVVAHEVGHILNDDCREMTKLVAMTSIVGLVSGLAFRMMSSNDSSGESNQINPIAIILIVLSLALLLMAPFLSLVARQFMSRERESNADALSVRLTRNPNALAHALLDIETTGGHVIEDSSSKRYYDYAGQLAFWGDGKATASHPPTGERIRALVAMGADPALLGMIVND